MEVWSIWRRRRRKGSASSREGEQERYQKTSPEDQTKERQKKKKAVREKRYLGRSQALLVAGERVAGGLGDHVVDELLVLAEESEGRVQRSVALLVLHVRLGALEQCPDQELSSDRIDSGKRPQLYSLSLLLPSLSFSLSDVLSIKLRFSRSYLGDEQLGDLGGAGKVERRVAVLVGHGRGGAGVLQQLHRLRVAL